MTAFPKPQPRPKAPRKRLVRTTWMRRRPPRRLDTAQSNPAFLDWVHGERCCLAGPTCRGRIEAHHAGRKPGLALKAPDDTCVPLCRNHHADVTERKGPFAGRTREEMRVTQDAWIAETTARYLAHGSRRG